MPDRRQSELRSWQPGYIDSLKYRIAGLLGDDRQAMRDAEKITSLLEYAPGVGDAMAAGEAADEYSAGNYGTAGLLAAGAMAGLVPGVGDAVQKGVKKGIRAYHGSPHDFDKFSLDKIGTGEGAQAYGHGLYFAESEDVARNYRDDLSKSVYSNPNRTAHRAMFADAVPANQEVADRIVDLINLHNKTPEEAVRLVGIGKNKEYVTQNKDALIKVANNIKAAIDNPNPGRMYEVNINADPNDFLDWDRPLSEQSESVRGNLEQLGIKHHPQLQYSLVPQDRSGRKYFSVVNQVGGEVGGSIDESAAKQMAEMYNAKPDTYDPVGEDIIDVIATRQRGDTYGLVSNAFAEKAASEQLRQAGIHGIKYLDAGSRSAGDGSRNYVVFDDALIEILRKYGLAGMGLLGAGAMQGGGEEPVY